MADTGITKFKIVPRSTPSGHALGVKLGSLVESATVNNAGTTTAASIYSDTKGTAITQPVSASNGAITFYTYMPSVDVIVLLTNGATISKSGVTSTTCYGFTYDTSIVLGNVVEGSGQKRADIIKTLSWSIGVPDADTDYNFEWDTSNPSDTPDEIIISEVIPSFARIIDMQFITTTASTKPITISIGSTSQGTEYHAASSMQTKNTILQFATSSLGEVDAAYGATDGSIYIYGDIGDEDWPSMESGEWRLSVTFIDFGQLVD